MENAPIIVMNLVSTLPPPQLAPPSPTPSFPISLVNVPYLAFLIENFDLIISQTLHELDV